MYYNYNGENSGRADDNHETNRTEDNDIKESVNIENEEEQKNDTGENAQSNGGNSPVYKYNDPWIESPYKQAKENTYNYYSPNYSAGSGYGYSIPERKRTEQYDANYDKSEKKKHGFIKIVALILVCTILCAAAGAGSAYLVIDHYVGDKGPQNSTTVVLGGANNSSSTGTNDVDEPVNADELNGIDIYKIAEKQVVGVSTTYTTKNIFGQESTSAVSGTGFVISEDGYILTNYHVIEYSVTYGYELKVTFKSGESYTAEIIGHYEANDVAVIKIDAEGLSPVTFGNSDKMQVGEKVYCVGNPLGELDFSMTSGYLSALDRLIATDNYTTINMFQMDAAVNSGNSGGPVYNDRGEVIGIVTAKYSESGVEGLGFAIPINDAVNIAKDLIEYGYLTGQAFLGVNVKDVESYVTNYYDIPKGAYIESITAGSCAEKAGIQAQDIIIGIDDYEISSVEQLKRTLRKYSAGDTATVKVYRSGAGTMDIKVTFDENLTNKKAD